MDRAPVVRAFGLYRSGTTWLQALVDENCLTSPVPPGAYCYKHCHQDSQVEKLSPDWVYLLTYKTPAKWVDSLCRNSFDLVDEYPWLAYRRGDTPLLVAYRDEDRPDQEPAMIGVGLESVLRLYHLHWDAWQAMTGRTMALVSHMAMVRSPAELLERTCRQVGVPLRPGDVKSELGLIRNSPAGIDRDLTLDPDAFRFLSGHQLDRIRLLQRQGIEEYLTA